ncbi:MAG: (Fe-S)-binding protein, partial [Desulfurococcales archaeon]|nr:(Fe-S)-binding protein [Desulfurococcales archaeon]
MKDLVEATLRLVRVSLMRTGLPVPAPRDVTYSWARGSGLPRRGKVYLYTGGMYQLAPYIRSSVSFLERTYKLGRAGVLAARLGELVTGRLPLHLIMRPPRRDVERSNRILRGIVRLLSDRVEGLAYLYEKDLYPGTIAYEYGLDDVFEAQAKRVYKALKDAGAEKLVTVDPHTTRILRGAMSEYIEGFDVEVVNYLELLAEGGFTPSKKVEGEAVIHDPCLYARFEGIIDQPRKLLGKAGLRLREPPRSRRLTYCCGGPIEGIMPSLAKKIASTRASELLKVSKDVIVMCPICWVNLEPHI